MNSNNDRLKEASANILEVLIQQARELICIHYPDGRFKYVSESSFKILGYTPEEMEGKNPYDFIHADDIELTKNEVHDTALRGETDSITALRYLHKNGSYVRLQIISQPVLNEQGQVKNIYTNSRDVTKEYAQRDELHRLTRLFENVSGLSGVGAWEYNLETGKILWTKEVFTIHEIDSGIEPSIEDGLNFFPAKARKTLSIALEEAIAQRKPYLLELPFVTAKGNKRWVRALGKPLFNRGKLEMLFGAFQDITEQRNIEIQLREKNQELQVLTASLSEKNIQLQDFSQIIAHNMRAPVGNLKTLGKFLLRSEDKSESEILTEQINESVDILNETFEELMEVLKVRTETSFKIKKVNIEEAFKKILVLFKGEIKTLNAKVELNLEAFEFLETYSIYFTSIFSNLVSNAFKYYNPEAPFEITIQNGFTDNGVPFITVEDNGLGIDLKKHSKKLFKLHKVFHRHPDAKGFGLFMTKNQVQALGAEIEVESTPLVGSAFTVYFKKNGKKNT